LKESGFVPYYKLGKFSKNEIKEQPNLIKEKSKYDNMMAKLQHTEAAHIYKSYLENKGQNLPNYIKKLKPLIPKDSNNDDDDFKL
jgi:hypothetical protein